MDMGAFENEVTGAGPNVAFLRGSCHPLPPRDSISRASSARSTNTFHGTVRPGMKKKAGKEPIGPAHHQLLLVLKIRRDGRRVFRAVSAEEGGEAGLEGVSAATARGRVEARERERTPAKRSATPARPRCLFGGGGGGYVPRLDPSASENSTGGDVPSRRRFGGAPRGP